MGIQNLGFFLEQNMGGSNSDFALLFDLPWSRVADDIFIFSPGVGSRRDRPQAGENNLNVNPEKVLS